MSYDDDRCKVEVWKINEEWCKINWSKLSKASKVLFKIQ